MPDQPLDPSTETGQSTTTQLVTPPTPTELTVWDNPTLTRFKNEDGTGSVEKLANSYIELEKMASSRIPVPTSESSSEDWTKFYSRFRPTTKDEYVLPMPGVDNVTEEDLSNWKQMFWDKGLPQDTVTHIMNRFTQDIVEGERVSIQQDNEQKVKTTVNLQQKWGANYEANRGMITSMLREMGGDNLVESLDGDVDHNTDVADFMYTVAKVLRSSEYVTGEGGGNFGLMSLNEASSEKIDIMTNTKHPLYSAYHSRENVRIRQPAMDRILELNKVISSYN